MAGRAHFSWFQRIVAAALLVSVVSGCAGFSLATPAEPVELVFVYLEDAANYEPLAQAFKEQHPNITVKLDPVPVVGYGARELLSKAEAADVLRLSTMGIPGELVDAFLPLDSFLSTSSGFSEDDLFAGSMDSLKFGGKQVGLPAGINPFVVYYSPAKFRTAGVEVPRPNWTLDDFVTTATALNFHDDAQVGSDRYAYGFCTHPNFVDLPLFTYLFGGRLFDSMVQVSRPMINDPANVEALTWYAGLKNNLDLIPDSPSTYQVGELIYRGGCGLWIDWLDKSNFGRDAGIDAEPLPLPRHVSDFNIASTDGYFVLAKTEHPEEAFLWASFLMQQQEASGRLVPPLKEAVRTAEYAARAPVSIVNVARSMPEQTVILSVEMLRDQRFGAVLEAFGQATEKVLSGEADPQTALDAAQAQLESSFK